TLYEPYFVSSATDAFGKTIYTRQPKVVRQAISKQTSEKLRVMLEKVVSEGGGHKAGVQGYRIGGKTGTAQKYENGHIAQGKYVSSFVGFAPVEDPRYVVAMIVDEPSGYMYYGSLVAAPYAGQVFEKIFRYTALAPQGTVPEQSVRMPDVLGLSVGEAVSLIKASGLNLETAGEGTTVIGTVPSAGTMIPAGDVVLIRTE
ncbi:MAG: PASTA domain-containing protein, partial [Clostridiales bacterium]|nr:PASTA domain-containing protein [Clostridiales bacterium]